jgi:hypothetical protein
MNAINFVKTMHNTLTLLEFNDTVTVTAVRWAHKVTLARQLSLIYCAPHPISNHSSFAHESFLAITSRNI